MQEVTVLVISYHSQNTVLETLESIKNQTYQKIHLAVSDDCSTDNSYALIKSWVRNHKSRFLSVKVRKTAKNLGVSRHMALCMRMVVTEWFKGIAADDILLPDCIEKYVDFISRHECHGMVYAKHLSFSGDEGRRKYFIDYEEQLYQKKFAGLSAEKQREYIAKREVLCSPTCFTNKADLLMAGGYDRSIRNIEDWPVKMRLLDSGFQMNRMDAYTVLYRVGNSISRSQDEFFKPAFLRMEHQVKQKYCYKTARKSYLYRWNEAWTYIRYRIIINMFQNKRNIVTGIVNGMLGIMNLEKLKKAVINTAAYKKSIQEVKLVRNHYGI